jgi:hypothetical protein
MRWIIVVAVLTGCPSSSPPIDAANDAAVDAAVDAAIDAPDVCAACRADQLCVASYNGTCGLSVQCVARTVDCPNNACSTACEAAYCPAPPYQCQYRAPCGGESPLAFTCYGP